MSQGILTLTLFWSWAQGSWKLCTRRVVRVHPARATHRLAGEFPSVLGSQCFGQRLSEEQVGKPDSVFSEKTLPYDDFGILGGLRTISLTWLWLSLQGSLWVVTGSGSAWPF